MKVCLITGEFPPMQGGVGDYTAHLATALAELGTQVHVITAARCRDAATPAVYVLHPIIARWDWHSALTIRRALAGIRPEVVHIQYEPVAYAMHPVANLLSWLLRLPVPWMPAAPRVLTTFHDLLVPYLFPKAGPLRWQAVLTLARGSHAVIVTNKEDWQRLRGYGWLRSLFLIPIGSNIAVEPPPGYERAAWRRRLGVADGEILLCYFGFLSEAKGGQTLIRALGRLPPGYRLLMVGGQAGDSDPSNRGYLEMVQALISELGLAERVLWTGFVTPQEVSAHLLAADMAVLPYREGANLRHGSLHACLAHGLPIITTRGWVEGSGKEDSAAGIPALIHGQHAWLVPPDDPEALAQAIATLAVAPLVRQRLGQGARELAQYFTWEAIAKQHLEVYQAI